MNNNIDVQTIVDYDSDLIGTIKSHLEALQGYDVMALEIIQNADDAKADEIVFDITKEGLMVWNSGAFSYCGNLSDRICRLQQTEKYACDFHRIKKVASGGKLKKSENIGRFGIGFVSTYQIADHPEIRSAGVKLVLLPETENAAVQTVPETDGTTFFLPWATDPNTDARQALGVSHVSPAHIDQLTNDIQSVLRKSLLFLRHVRKAEVRRDGKLLLGCDLDRGDNSSLVVSIRPTGLVEHWRILRADAKVAAEKLYPSHPRLEALNRGTGISIGLRLAPEPLSEGYLYAFLPTEQSTGLPLHINADFFPESDRKAVVFAGHQHQQAWNEMLIDAAATELARDPEGLMQMLGHAQLWQIIGRSYDLARSQHHPSCFAKFWERVKATGSQSRIALAQDGTTLPPNAVLLPRSQLNELQVNALGEMNGRVVIEDLRPYQNALNQLGAPILTLERLTNLMATAFASHEAGVMEISDEKVDGFYRPLWSIVNDLLPEQTNTPNPTVIKLQGIPFVLTEDSYLVTINQSYLAQHPLRADQVASLLPRLAILSRHILGFPRIASLVNSLELATIASHLKSEIEISESAEDVISNEKAHLRDLYSIFADLDRQSSLDRSVYQILRSLPIWLSGKGLIKADQALLPGNFNDPTGQADLLDPSALTDSAREFVSNKLGVKSQTIETFVQTVLPRFFDEDGPIDASKYQRLVTELAEHPSLINDDNIRRLLASLPFIPTQDGNWSKPSNTYRRTDELVRVLGDATHLWVDPTRIPNARSVYSFLDELGIRRSPIARHLVDRILYIAKKFLPTEDAIRASGEAFYVLCDNYEAWKDKSAFQDAIADLKEVDCFPGDGDEENWYSASNLYAPYRSEAFRSQVSILDYTSNRLKREFLVELGIETEPETDLVIKHLLYCAERNVDPHLFTYQILNERAKDSDSEIQQLRNKRCIHVESQKSFVRPNQVYWTAQQLGRFAFSIPAKLEGFKPLFSAIGVKNAPDTGDYVDLLLDVVGEYFEQGNPIVGADRGVYEACLNGIVTADSDEKLEDAELTRLQQSPSILNLLGQATHPDELLLQDSEWHAAFFNGELNRALCKPSPELWPLLERVGVRRLSKCAEVALEFVDGERRPETTFADKLLERSEVLARLLHNKSTSVRKKIANSLSELSAFSYDVVRIQTTVNLGENTVNAPPSSTQAFFDINQGHLILARPVGDRSWAHALNALFHQLMPEEPGSEISMLTLSIRPLMAMPVEDAHRELTDAGIPFIDAEQVNGQYEDLTSPELDDIGSSGESDSEPEVVSLSDAPWPANPAGSPENPAATTNKPNESNPSLNSPDSPVQKTAQTKPSTSTNATVGTDEKQLYGGGHRSSSVNSGGSQKSRPKHKEQWDRRLLSYVRKKSDSETDSENQDNPSEHNLAVEVIARGAVCAYEKARGRVAEQMPQTHPGYDIISRNPITGEDRFIEVKGVNGEWNQTGVGLSRLQFSNAQDYGDRYWLYVVEFVAAPQHTRVHPIRSPATQVTSFMFDGNWRDAVADERADPALAFIVGASLKHQYFGFGHIESMELRGSTRVMSIEFENIGRRTVTLNLHTMQVVEEKNGDDDS
jgi:hypothetical protein